MSTKTVGNMNLIVVEMFDVLFNEDYKGLKALSHSYETLATQLNNSHEDFKKDILRQEISRQVTLIETLHNKLETISIPHLLGNKNYLDVNHLTTTVARLNKILEVLQKLRLDLYECFLPKVAIFSNTRDGDTLLWKNLIEENNEIVLKHNTQASRDTVLTDKNNYTYVYNVNDGMRGHRFDKVYVDKNLEGKLIEICKMMVKDKNNITMF